MSFLVYGNTCDILIFMCRIRLSEMERMQHVAQNNARRIIEETEKLKCDLESKSMELDKWSQQLEEEKKRVMSLTI